jgi:hypothetical protein
VLIKETPFIFTFFGRWKQFSKSTQAHREPQQRVLIREFSKSIMPHRVSYAAQKDHITELLSPTNGYRGNLLRRGVKPKDHEKENRRNIRRMQESREEGMSPMAKPAFKMRCFQEVRSRVFETENQPATAKSFLRRGEGKLSKEAQRAPVDGGRREATTKSRRRLTKPPVPRQNEWMELAPRSTTNHIRGNIHQVLYNDEEEPKAGATHQAAAPPSPPGAKSTRTKSPAAKSSPGEVPKYLQLRMQEMAEAEALRKDRERQENEAPPGLKLMSKKEQRETLAVLQKSRAETQRQLTAMPLDLSTPRRQRRKGELETKLLEIEQAICVFQNPQVFVQR